MKRVGTILVAAAMMMAMAAAPAHARGVGMDPDGVFGWFWSIFSDQGSLDYGYKGLGSDPNG